jgi:hypothetical protein
MTKEPNKSSLTTSNYNRSSLLGSMANTKKTEPIHDSHDEYGFSEGVMSVGTLDDTTSLSYDMSYDIGQLDLFTEEDMREKYPALKQAHEHYQSILEVCKTKEREDEN